MTTDNTKKLSISREAFEQVLSNLGVSWQKQSGFHKVQGQKLEGEKDSQYRLYIANGKTCNRVDLSGFTTDFGTKVPDQGVFGNVKQQMLFGETEEDTLRTFAALVEHMMSLEPVKPEPKAKKQKAPKNAGAEVNTAAVLPDDEASKAARVARLAKIKQLAEEKGLSVSKKTLAEAGELPAETIEDGAEPTQPAGES